MLRLLCLGILLFTGGCAVSPDRTNYQRYQDGLTVDEGDQSLAAVRIEPKRADAAVPAQTPSGEKAARRTTGR